MTLTIARKELIGMLRDARFRICCVVVLLLLGAALLTGFVSRRAYEQQRANAVKAERHAWVNQGEANPHSAAHFGRYAFKPLLAASLLDKGLNSYLGQAVYIEGHVQNPFRHRPAEDSTGLLQFGEMTGAAVLQYLLPLVILLLTFNAFAGEREQGTLRQLLSLGVPPAKLLAGKAIGIVTALAALLLPAAVLGAFLMQQATAGDASQSALRLAVMTGAYLLYLLAFTSLSLGVSASAATSRMALLVLLGFWVSSSLLVPRAAASLAESFYPTPILPEFLKEVNEDMEKGIDGHKPPGEKEEELKQTLLKKYNVKSEKDLPINLTGLILQESEEHGNLVFDKHFRQLRDAYGKQYGVLQAASLVSPLLAVRSFSMGLAGTDLWHHHNFADAAEAYRRKWVKRLNDDMTNNSRTGDFSYKVGRTFWEATEDFKYTPPGVGEALRTQTGSLLLLAGWLLGSILFAAWAVRRMSAIEEA